MNILGAIGSLLNPIKDIVDEFHTSPEEKLEMKAKLLEIETKMYQQAFDLEKADLDARAKIIVAEANSQSWIARNWRPIIMLEFGALIPLIGTGLLKVEYLAAVPQMFWSLLTVGIGGYIGARSYDKRTQALSSRVMEGVSDALKAPEQA